MQGRGLGLNPPLLKLDISQNFITCVKGINCFRILFACSFVDLMYQGMNLHSNFEEHCKWAKNY